MKYSYILYKHVELLWRWHINKIIDFLEIIHHPVIFIKNNVSETGFCLHPQVEAYSVWPNRQS
jgi:hypothetical protein